MKVFTCTGFQGHYPVGTSAVVVAETAEAAALALREALQQEGLLDSDAPMSSEAYSNWKSVTANSLLELDLTTPSCEILNNGNY